MHMPTRLPSGTRRAFMLAALAGTLSLAAPGLQAQPLSDRPIRIIVGAPPGGTADTLARLIGEGLNRNLGQPVIVDNKPGALGALAMDAFLAAPRDGHTYLLSVNGLFSEVPYTIKPKYDPLKDVKPLVELGGSGLVMAVGLNVNTTNPPTPEEMSKTLAADYRSVGEMLKSVDYKPE